MKATLKYTYTGNYDGITNFLKKIIRSHNLKIAEKYAKLGVEALSDATPVDTGKTASSWYYEIVESDSGLVIRWNNSNINKGISIALLIQDGHGTRNGGYVEGIDYINPALQPIFKELADKLWREVTKS